MYRSILTTVLVLVLAASAHSIAAADESAAASDAAATTAAAAPAAATAGSSVEAPTPVAVEAAQSPSEASTGDAVAPTAGADLAMWNAAPAGTDPAGNSARPMSRLQRFASGIMRRSSAIASSLTRSAMRFIGVPYVFGGTRITGFDCSGYVQHVFGMNGLHLPRTADAQYDAARRVAATRMVPGDLVFFHTYAPGVSHVGIYLGHDKFIHASSSRGVAVSSLRDHYWAPRYLGAKRVVGT